MSTSKQVIFTPASAKQFAREHNRAVKDKKTSFIFNGDTYVTTYAHYVLEYLAMNNLISGKFNDQKLFIYE